mgnify:CR=1 FL=1
MAKIDESRPFIPVRIAVLTVSDTRGPADDKSGDTLAALIAATGTAPLTYQWRKGGVDLSGENGTSLVIDPAAKPNADLGPEYARLHKALASPRPM